MTWTLSLISLVQVSYVELLAWSMKNYDYGYANNMRPEKSRDLGVYFWSIFEYFLSNYRKKNLQQIATWKFEPLGRLGSRGHLKRE